MHGLAHYDVGCVVGLDCLLGLVRLATHPPPASRLCTTLTRTCLCCRAAAFSHACGKRKKEGEAAAGFRRLHALLGPFSSSATHPLPFSHPTHTHTTHRSHAVVAKKITHHHFARAALRHTQGTKKTTTPPLLLSNTPHHTAAPGSRTRRPSHGQAGAAVAALEGVVNALKRREHRKRP